jgi:uncharacterized protein YegP (UPF0339 family)
MGKFVIKETKTGVKFDLKATNGQVIASSQVYASPVSCKKGIESVVKNAAIAAVEDQTVEGYAAEKNPKFEIYADKAGEFRFRLKARNGQIIAVSEGYKTLKNCEKGIASVKKNAVGAKIEKAEKAMMKKKMKEMKNKKAMLIKEKNKIMEKYSPIKKEFDIKTDLLYKKCDIIDKYKIELDKWDNEKNKTKNEMQQYLFDIEEKNKEYIQVLSDKLKLSENYKKTYKF